MGKVVGIDLGTTNSVVAVMEGGRPVVIANAEGMRTTPSVVAFSNEGEKLIGQMARRQAVLNPQNTFYGVKRFIGRKYAELTSESKRVPYTVRKDSEGNVKIRSPRLDKSFAPEEISAMVLRKLAEEASRYLGQPVTGAVITVPAYFNDAQRQATRDAGRIAGLEVKRIINEPTAAALAYGLEQEYNQTILVFDLGGGTFDVSILEVGDGVFQVRSTSGDTQLGGTNFDQKIIDWLANTFLEKEGIDLRRDGQSLQRLTEAAEKAKIELSGVASTEINLPFITATEEGPKHIETRLERSQFESLCADLVSQLQAPLKQAMADAGLSPSQIDEVVLVGGASRMPMVQDLVRSLMGRVPNQNVNPDEVVGVGAAIQAGILTNEVKDIMLLDVSPLSLGLETIGGVMKKIIPRNTTIPVRRSDVFSTSENNQTVVEVHVLQGEREMVADNKSLGRFKLMGIPPAPRGIPQVQVAFDIDANGILQVSAMDKTTGRQQSITVQEASNLSEEKIQEMIREAEEFAETDRLQRERIEKRNRAEVLTFQAERVLREVALDFGLQFSRDRRRRIEALIQELRDGLARNDERGIDIAQADLQDEVYELNREAYLYDLDDEEDGFLGQIGGTLRRAFAGDDEDYRREYDYNSYPSSGYPGSSYPGSSYPGGRAGGWEQQAQWDDPEWGGRRQRSSSWDDWNDDWESGNPRDRGRPDRDRPTAPGTYPPPRNGRSGADLGGASRQPDAGFDPWEQEDAWATNSRSTPPPERIDRGPAPPRREPPYRPYPENDRPAAYGDRPYQDDYGRDDYGRDDYRGDSRYNPPLPERPGERANQYRDDYGRRDYASEYPPNYPEDYRPDDYRPSDYSPGYPEDYRPNDYRANDYRASDYPEYRSGSRDLNPNGYSGNAPEGYSGGYSGNAPGGYDPGTPRRPVPRDDRSPYGSRGDYEDDYWGDEDERL